MLFSITVILRSQDCLQRQIDTVFARGKCMMKDKQLLEYGYYRYDD